MLNSFSIRNIVLIEELEVVLAPGLCAFSGETGAGKSILLDALGLVIGERADPSLIRQGASHGVITAEFTLSPLVQKILQAHDLEVAPTILLRRVLNREGRHRAYINDQPVSVGLLRQVGQAYLSIHGQFDESLDPSSQLSLVDQYSHLDTSSLSQIYDQWQSLIKTYEEAALMAQPAYQDYLRHACEELSQLNPQSDEETELVATRTTLLQQQKIQELVEQAWTSLKGSSNQGSRSTVSAQDTLYAVLRLLERAAVHDSSLTGIIEKLHTLIEDINEVISRVEETYKNSTSAQNNLEATETRLFALRTAARKYNISPSELPELLGTLQRQLAQADNLAAYLTDLDTQIQHMRDTYKNQALALHTRRQEVAEELTRKINAELPALKLEHSTFKIVVSEKDENGWNASGYTKVAFMVSTNNGPLGTLEHIASGGEQARLKLALKAVFAQSLPPSTLIFDEIDQGIGGSTATAVAERLACLATYHQVLIVTHSPQVASRAAHHWQVYKEHHATGTITYVKRLKEEERQEEIARMLAGAKITQEARAAAAQLLEPVFRDRLVGAKH